MAMDRDVIKDKLRKAADVWKHALQDDRQRDHTSRSRDELEFLPAALEVIETPPSPTARFTFWSIVLLFIIAIVWASIGTTDVVVIAQGKIIASGRSLVVQPLESGIIRAIYVREGQEVARGDVLIELDPTDAEADKQRLQDMLIQQMLTIARLRAMLEHGEKAPEAFTPPEMADAAQVATARLLMRSQLSEQQARLQNIDANIRRAEAEREGLRADVTRLQRILPIIEDRARSQYSLAQRGLAPRNTALQLQQELISAQQEFEVLQSRLQQVAATIASAREQREQTIAEFERARLSELTEAQQQVASLRQELLKVTERYGRSRLIAPDDGTIMDLQVTTVGGVVTPAQELMKIIPKDAELEIEAMLMNKDRGSVKPGDIADIKLEAYNFLKYGTILGRVRFISSDAFQHEQLGPVFTLRATMDSSTMMVDGKNVTLTPGLAATVEIKTDTRTILEFLLNPIRRSFSEAAREQ